MKEASRWFSVQKKVDKESPIFKSKVRRQIIEVGPEGPGPGTYNLILPLVKPKYEAIFKNNRSIIIKVNDSPNAAFCVKQPRFKQYSTIQSNNFNETNFLVDIDKEIRPHKNSKRYNFSLAKKKSLESISHTVLVANHRSEDENELNAGKIKGTNWSKYREVRKMWMPSLTSAPGPGAYQSIIPSTKYFQQNNSWQFKSSTKKVFSKLPNSNEQQMELVADPQKFNSSSIHSRHNIPQCYGRH